MRAPRRYPGLTGYGKVPKRAGRLLVASRPSERRHGFKGVRARSPRVVPNKLGSIAVLPGC